MTARPKPLVLIILDGFGEREERADNAIRLARAPALSALFEGYPRGLIGTSGPDVGLPPGQMGNSEVGHLNLGAGRIAMMDISRIDNAVHDGTLAKNGVLVDVLAKAKKARGRLHLLGLVSDGGVHSSLVHLFALIDVAKSAGVPVVVHAFLDGRDVQPGTARGYLASRRAEARGRRRPHRHRRGPVLGDGSRQPLGARRARVSRHRRRPRARRARFRPGGLRHELRRREDRRVRRAVRRRRLRRREARRRGAPLQLPPRPRARADARPRDRRVRFVRPPRRPALRSPAATRA